MIVFKTILLKFDKQGEKTGWTYIEVPQHIADKIKPGYKRSYRVKGTLDEFKIQSVAMIPMGGGDFIIPVNAVMRKAIMKRKGDTVKVSLEVDEAIVKISTTLMECMEDDPAALDYFKKLPKSHQNYYSKWIESAKTEGTKAKRIALTINACSKKMSFSQMMQSQKKDL